MICYVLSGVLNPTHIV